MAKGKKKKRVGQALIGILVGANLFTILLLWLCVGCAYITPEVFPQPSLVCLTFPVILFFNLLFLLLWILVRIRMVWLPLAGMLCMGLFIQDYCPLRMPFASKANTDSTLCLITLNAGGITSSEFDSLTDYVERMNPDILCLQELNNGWLWTERTLDWTHKGKYERIISNGRAILTRFPILSDTLQIKMPSSSNGIIAIWMDVNGDSVMLCNCHLESNRLDPEDKDQYKEAIRDPKEEHLRQSGKLLARKLIRSASKRAQQTDTLCNWIDRHEDTSVILCGDFNDTPISYACLKMGRRLRSAYTESGAGIGISFNQGGFPVRIDHAYHSADWQSVHTYIDRSLSLSDHYPLVTYLRRKK